LLCDLRKRSGFVVEDPSKRLDVFTIDRDTESFKIEDADRVTTLFPLDERTIEIALRLELELLHVGKVNEAVVVNLK
jgi:hypothetical protein